MYMLATSVGGPVLVVNYAYVNILQMFITKFL